MSDEEQPRNTPQDGNASLPGETRALITGANGFVGRHLIAHLLDAQPVGEGAASTRVFAGVLPHQAAEWSAEPAASFDAAGWAGGSAGGRVEVVGLELDDAEGLKRLIGQAQPRHIYHLAARSSGADADREAVFTANVTGTRNLLESAALLSPFPRVLLASTGYVYGNTDANSPAQETDPIGPLWKYGAYTDSKIEMETVARAYRGFALVARAFAHTGPGQLPTFAVPAFARQIARMERGLEPLELRVGNLDAWRDLLDVRDVVRAYAALMARPSPAGLAGEAVNIALGRPVQMRFVVERLCALSAIQPKIMVDPDRLRPLDIACSTGDPARLQGLTGWRAKYALDDTLRDMLDYWRNRAEA